MNKHNLRRQIGELIKELALANKQEQSRVVFEKLIVHPKFKEAKSLSIYLSTENEVDTRPILRHALEVLGKKCFVPFICKDKAMQGDSETRMVMIELESMKEFEEMPLNRYGIKEHTMEQVNRCGERTFRINKDNLDLMIVPGVAFSYDGRRLGHGKGYYDEFLTKMSAKSKLNKPGGCVEKKDGTTFAEPPYTIGLAFNEQMVDDPLSVEGHDFKLDEVLTARSIEP